MSRIRTIGKAVEEIQKVDPNTSITVWNLRQLALKGEIKCWMSGNRRLIDVDQVLEYFNVSEENKEDFIIPAIRRR